MDTLVTNIQGFSIHDGPGIRTVVFFKGCALSCRWCSNPECISPLPEIGLVKNLCTGCGNCAGVCPEGALLFEEGNYPKIDRGKCNGCGGCSAVCTYNALVRYGEKMSTGEIFETVKKDKMFYDSSGGGITVSGGEALLNPLLVYEIFTMCRQQGILTCMETSGCVPASSLQQVLPVTDYILFDLKHLDSATHRRYTGKPNELILENAGIVSESGTDFLFRMPLVPGVNDDDKNIGDTAAFLHGLGNNACRIELMPYHRLGKGKYESLNREYGMPEIPSPGPDYLDSIRRSFEDSGIACTISS